MRARSNKYHSTTTHTAYHFSPCAEELSTASRFIYQDSFFLFKKKRIFLSNYCHSFVSLLFWVVCRYHLHGILRSLPLFLFFYDNSFFCSRSTSNSIRYDTITYIATTKEGRKERKRERRKTQARTSIE